MPNFKQNANHLKRERYLPHNFLAEKIVLSSLLLSSDAVDFTIQHVTVEMFYFKNHQEIYKIILLFYKKNQPIDLIALISFIQDNGLLNKIGGINVLINLVDQIPNFIYLKEYIKLLQDKFLRRLLIRFGYQIINSSYITNISLEHLLSDLENQLFNITAARENLTLLSSAELLSTVFQDLKKKSIHSVLPGLQSGFKDLDLITQGFQKSDLIIVAGRPAMGKTALCLNIASCVCKNRKLPILFFSLEMSKEQLMYRLLANETEISTTSLKTGNIDKISWDKLNLAIQELSLLPFFIDDTPNISFQNIRFKIKKILFEQTRIGLVVIDYLQLMQVSTQTENRVQELSQITRTLKAIAREFKVPIIALSQLSRNVEARVDKRPVLSDLRESGSIEQDADLVLMLYRESYYMKPINNFLGLDPVELIVAKHRNGPIGTVNLKFDAKHTRFLPFN